ncbi:MAG: hypothetical protein ACMUIS_07705 [bacterium]
MFRKIFWINVALVTIIILLSYNLYSIWSEVLSHEITLSTSQPRQEDIATVAMEGGEPDYEPSSRMSYEPIIEKDLFRPEREEWQPPPPPEEEEVQIQQTAAYPGFPGQPPQQEIKKPNLYGVIIIGEDKYAIMQGWMREEQQERTRKIRLGNGQIREVPLPPIPGKISKDKIEAYRIGDYVSEAQLVDIMPEKVIMEQENGERYDLLLREPAELEMWKPALAEGEGEGGQEGGPGQLMQPGGQPYPVPPGVPMYPRFVPAYPMPVPPGYVPPQGIPQGQQAPAAQVPSPPIPSPQQRTLPNRPGFPPGRIPYPPGRTFPGR